MATLPQIRLDGTIRFFAAPANVPEGWTPSPDDPLVYLPPWQPCKYRILNRNNRTMTIVPLCRAKGVTVDHATCADCQMHVVPDEGHYQRMHHSQIVGVDLPDPHRPPHLQGTVISESGPRPVPADARPVPPQPPASVLRHQRRWEPFVPKVTVPYSQLTGLEATLPPHKEGRDRPLHFEPDGTIVYEQQEGEPPRDINGYQRDPDNPFRFTPLWSDCRLRHQTAVRFANCGCIDVIMRCNNPALPQFADRVKHTTCQECPQRKAE